MASTGINNATLLKLSVDGANIENLITNNMDLTMDTRDITTKDSSGKQDLGTGKTSGSTGFESLFNEAATTNFQTLFTAWNGRIIVAFIYSTGVVGDLKYSGNGYVTSLSMGGGTEDNQSFSGTLSITGGVTEAVIT